MGFVKSTWRWFPERSKEAVAVPRSDLVLFCKSVSSQSQEVSIMPHRKGPVA